ncbi:MAG: hypothetical protein ACLQDY_02285 [Streptosporangiaceae bacterium]
MLGDGPGIGPVNLISIVPRHSASAGGGLFPDISDDGQPSFESSEHTIWSGGLRVGLLRQRANDRPLARIWEFPEPAEVWLTDRRLAFICRKFTAGDWKTAWLDWTEFLASTVNSISAEMKRHGRLAIGQVRYEWPVSFQLMSRRVNMRQITLLGVNCVDPWDGAIVRLVLYDKSQELVAHVTRMMIKANAAYRLHRSAPADAAVLLSQLAQYPITDDQRRPFGSAAGDSHRFSGLRPGESMTFSMPGATKISGWSAVSQSAKGGEGL